METQCFTKEDIISNLNKTDVYPFTVIANVVLEGQPFIVNSLLNGLRSKLYGEIFYRNLHKKCDIIFNFNDFCNAKSSANTNISPFATLAPA